MDVAYFGYSHDVISIVPLVPSDLCYYACSFSVMKQVFGNEDRIHTVKPKDLTLALSAFYGTHSVLMLICS